MRPVLGIIIGASQLNIQQYRHLVSRFRDACGRAGERGYTGNYLVWRVLRTVAAPSQESDNETSLLASLEGAIKVLSVVDIVIIHLLSRARPACCLIYAQP